MSEEIALAADDIAYWQARAETAEADAAALMNIVLDAAIWLDQLASGSNLSPQDLATRLREILDTRPFAGAELRLRVQQAEERVERAETARKAWTEIGAQADRARDAERAARRNAEADTAWWRATVANYLTSQPQDRELMRDVLSTAVAELHPGAALLAELEAARPIVAAARAWREAVETMDGQWAAEQALLAALKASQETGNG